MRNHGQWFLAGAAICAAAIGVFAQAAPARRAAQAPAAQRPAPPPGASTQRYVIIGCIAREAQPAAAAGSGAAAASRFTITDRRGERPTTYRLQGDPKELDLRVGHTVEIAGTLSAQPGAGRGPNAGALVLNVASLTWISTTCQK